MKTLYLLRHAKSSRDNPDLADRDRPLAAHGEHEAATMGKRWSRRLGKPELILASPALRTHDTARIIAKAFDYKRSKIVLDERLYATTSEALIAIVEALDDKLRRVMIVGHNPELTELARHFDADIVDLRTCALVELEFDIESWSDLAHTAPAIVMMDSPKS